MYFKADNEQNAKNILNVISHIDMAVDIGAAHLISATFTRDTHIKFIYMQGCYLFCVLVNRAVNLDLWEVDGGGSECLLPFDMAVLIVFMVIGAWAAMAQVST